MSLTRRRLHDMESSSRTSSRTSSPTPSTTSSTHRIRIGEQSHLRVLIYTTCYNVIDGVTLTIRKLEEDILAQGGHVMILTTKSGDLSQTHLTGTHPNRNVTFLDSSLRVPVLSDPNNPNISYHFGCGLSRKTRKQIDDFEPSIVHITVPDNVALHLIRYARKKEVPIMGTYHSNLSDYMDHYPGFKWMKYFIIILFRHAYCFLQHLYVPTPYIHKHLVDSIQADKLTSLGVWGRGIDLNAFSPQHRSDCFRKALGISKTDIVVCWVGRFVAEKRPDIFAHVIRKLHAQGVPFKAIVIGTGPAEKEFRGLPNTTLLGWLSGEALSVAYASSDVFLFPSAVETFGNVTLEAAASGLPLVVEAGCSGHLVEVGKNGFACDALEKESFYISTLALVQDNEMRNAFSCASREFSLGFEKQTVNQRMIENYATVTEEFYYDYGGHHKNRDLIYQKEGGMLSGTYPITTLAILLESLLWFTMSILCWLETHVLYYPRNWARTLHEVVRLSAVSDEQKSRKKVVDESTDLDLVLDGLSTKAVRMLESSERPSTLSCSDLACMLLMTVFNMILFQFRMESKMRNAVSDIMSYEFRGSRKHKNSTFAE